MALGVFKKLARGLSRTRENLAATLQTVVGSAEIDEDALDELEVSLLAADLGPQLTEEVIGAVRERAGKGAGSDLREAVRQTLRGALPAKLTGQRQEIPRRAKADGVPVLVIQELVAVCVIPE